MNDSSENTKNIVQRIPTLFRYSENYLPSHNCAKSYLTGKIIATIAVFLFKLQIIRW